VKVFISYSRLDASETAKTIHNYLTEIGHQAFIDTSDIRGGDEWRNTIQNEISTCDIFVIIVTRSSLRREEVKNELELAKTLNKKIIPCIAKKFVQYQDLQWDLNKYQGVMFERLDDLIQELDYMIESIENYQRNHSNLTFSEKQNLETKPQNIKNSAIDSLTKEQSVSYPLDKNINENFQETSTYTNDVKTNTTNPIKPNIDEIKSNKDVLQTYLERAKSFEKTKQYQRALIEYEKALKIDCDNV
jgi:tetratricopeptide (TPR) repeat protein